MRASLPRQTLQLLLFVVAAAIFTQSARAAPLSRVPTTEALVILPRTNTPATNADFYTALQKAQTAGRMATELNRKIGAQAMDAKTDIAIQKKQRLDEGLTEAAKAIEAYNTLVKICEIRLSGGAQSSTGSSVHEMCRTKIEKFRHEAAQYSKLKEQMTAQGHKRQHKSKHAVLYNTLLAPALKKLESLLVNAPLSKVKMELPSSIRPQVLEEVGKAIDALTKMRQETEKIDTNLKIQKGEDAILKPNYGDKGSAIIKSLENIKRTYAGARKILGTKVAREDVERVQKASQHFDRWYRAYAYLP